MGSMTWGARVALWRDTAWDSDSRAL